MCRRHNSGFRGKKSTIGSLSSRLSRRGRADWRGLTDAQAQALVYARSAGHTTNTNVRDLAGLETLEASARLRRLRNHGLLELRGTGAAAQWVLSEMAAAAGQETQELVTKTQELEPKTQDLATKTQELPEILLRQVWSIH